MKNPYPDTPWTTPINQTGEPMLFSIQWNKWFQGLRVLINQLAVGQDVNGTFHTTDGKTITITNGVVSNIQ